MEIIERFATELRLTGKSAHTIAAYAGDVRRLVETVGKERASISSDDVRAYLHLRMEQQIAPASLNRMIVALREYFTYLETNGTKRIR